MSLNVEFSLCNGLKKTVSVHLAIRLVRPAYLVECIERGVDMDTLVQWREIDLKLVVVKHVVFEYISLSSCPCRVL